MEKMKRKAILCIDNAPSHIFDDSNLTNTKIVFLPPNLTSHIQPMDAGIIWAFKAHYHQLFILRALEHYENGQEAVYHIDQLEGMNLTVEAWSYISSKTVANCWKHAGILMERESAKETAKPTPSTKDTIAKDTGIQSAVDDLRKALSSLKATHVASKNLPTAELPIKIFHFPGNYGLGHAGVKFEDVIEHLRKSLKRTREECF